MITNGAYDVPAGKVAEVVTYLEMRAAPEIQPVEPPEGVAFRQVTPDVAWFRDVFDRVGAEWLWFGRRKITDAALGDILEDPKVVNYTLTKDGRDEALLELDFRQDGECELAYFGLTGKLIGTGSGRFLMSKAIALAWARDISRLHVHTCSLDSPQALGFYIRSGFTPYKRAVEINDDPRLTGHLPETAGPHVPLIRPE
ncbi:MAG: GNAT family N-acetyltransferase [Sulfitobacter sp.]